jgi:hypothetical protein
MNFFNWVREGVRQAVLLGVSDAVQGIGTPPNGEDMGQKLLDVVRKGAPEYAPANTLTLPPRRRKLGRSLNEIQTTLDKPAATLEEE